MAYRPTWQGHLKLSLVTCPVALYTATNSGGDVHFHLINPKTNNRIKMITTDPDTGPIERRLQVYRDKTVPLLEYYADREWMFTVDGAQPAAAVHEDIVACLQGWRTSRCKAGRARV